MSTFREAVRAELDAFKQVDRGSPLVDAVAMNVLVSSFVLAVATKDRAQCRVLLARLVALGSLLADHPELQAEAPVTPATHAPAFDEPVWTLETWEADLASFATIDAATKTWIRHRHLFDGKSGPSPARAWKALVARCNATKVDVNDVKDHVAAHDAKRGSRA